jgi:hypothetical protein
VIRIDEVTRHGNSKIRELDGNAIVTPFPAAFTTQGKKSD